VNVQHNKSGGGAGGYHYKIAMVTHGGAGDSFWSIVKAGGVQAGKDMGDDFTYQSNGDPTQQSQLIDAAVNQKPDGLIVSMANPEALKAAIQRAVAAGIPVVTINSGQAQSKAYGALSLRVRRDRRGTGGWHRLKAGRRQERHLRCPGSRQRRSGAALRRREIHTRWHGDKPAG